MKSLRKSIQRTAGMIALFALASSPRIYAQSAGGETKVMIRVLARDAKLIGKGVGGARITVRDAASGKVLAQGMEQDGTGDTALIIEKPHVRGAQIFDTPGASGFLAVLALERPTVVEISAEGPLGTQQATQRASKTLLLVPGQDVMGDGVVLEIHGFIVKALSPQLDAKLKVESPFEVRATVTMACGCPTEPGGLWDANKIKVVARVVRAGKVESEIPMKYAGVQNTFTGTAAINVAGAVELQVLAMDPADANFGLAHQDLTVIP